MLVFFLILGFLLTISLILFFSSIRLELEKIKIDTTKKSVINDYKINIYLAFLNKIKYFKISIYKEKIDKMKNFKINKIKEKVTNLKVFKSLKEKGLIQNTGTISKAIKKTHIRIEKLDLNASIGIENIIILSYLVATIDILISLLLARRTTNNLKLNDISEKYNYTIVPEHTKKFYLKTNINAEFSLKISNIVKNIL